MMYWDKAYIINMMYREESIHHKYDVLGKVLLVHHKYDVREKSIHHKYDV